MIKCYKNDLKYSSMSLTISIKVQDLQMSPDSHESEEYRFLIFVSNILQ